MKEAIAIGAGALISLALELIPAVQRWWAKRAYKVLMLLGFYIGTAVIIWLLRCLLGFEFPFYLACDYQGFAAAAWTGTLSFIANQITYHTVTVRLQVVKRRKLVMAEHRIRQYTGYDWHV